MNTNRHVAGRCRRLWGLGIVSLLLGQSLVAQSGLYQAIRGSTLQITAPGATTSSVARVTGPFTLTPRPSPLDIDLIAVEDLRFEILTGGHTNEVMRATGLWRISQRFQRQQLQLTATFRGSTILLDTGDQPAGPPVTDLSFHLKGTAKTGPGAGVYVLELAAVPERARWHYRLIEGSTLVDNCIVCRRPTFFWPLRGDFDLVLVEETMLASRYHVFNAHFQTASGYQVDGEGEYTVGGEVALRQQFRLDADVTWNSGETKATGFTSEPASPMRRWPMLSLDGYQTNGVAISTIGLQLQAAPFRELWFSTTAGMTPGVRPPITEHLSAGDLLTDTGRRIRSHAELLVAEGWPEPPPDLPLDAFTVNPGGEVLFSFVNDTKTPTLGPVGSGDLVSERGRIVKANADLLTAFQLQPPVSDLGLDGLQRGEGDEWWFSITGKAFSEKLGANLDPGDLLASSGVIVKPAKALLAALLPTNPDAAPGLDAFHLWPSGEVWFSTTGGFDSQVVGLVHPGDLLSDQGYVVFRNLELVGAFQPLEDLADFGLDGLFIVSDFESTAATGFKVQWQRNQAGGVDLTWTGPGRVFQVERTPDLRDPFVAVSPVLAATVWSDAAPPSATAYYRVRQW